MHMEEPEKKKRQKRENEVKMFNRYGKRMVADD